jgi:hypothetical protein
MASCECDKITLKEALIACQSIISKDDAKLERERRVNLAIKFTDASMLEIKAVERIKILFKSINEKPQGALNLLLAIAFEEKTLPYEEEREDMLIKKKNVVVLKDAIELSERDIERYEDAANELEKQFLKIYRG